MNRKDIFTKTVNFEEEFVARLRNSRSFLQNKTFIPNEEYNNIKNQLLEIHKKTSEILLLLEDSAKLLSGKNVTPEEADIITLGLKLQQLMADSSADKDYRYELSKDFGYLYDFIVKDNQDRTKLEEITTKYKDIHSITLTKDIKENKSVFFTGPRPAKLYGYDLNSPAYKKLFLKLTTLVEKLIKRDYTIFWTGGALGFDTLAFLVIHKLKTKYPHIKNNLAVPFKNQYIKWPKESQDFYHTIVANADSIVYVDALTEYQINNDTPVGTYSVSKMHKRNHFLVDNSSLGISCMPEGYIGGTKECVNYAIKKGIKMLNINPLNMKIDN